ncbi:MAG TPA: hypothetical protein DEB39_06935 [Planctomycetaceae bacterium]|nr:hypothetical protein [Planctomycetaceae bacterium]
MLDKILRITGTGALYFCSSMFFAILLLGAYLTFAWSIDKDKLNRMVSVAQGADAAADQEALRRAVEDRIAQMTYDEVLAKRAERSRQEEFDSEKIGLGADRVVADGLKIEAQIDQLNAHAANFEKRLQDVRKQAQDEGILQETGMIEKMPPEQAKKVLLDIIKQGGIERVIVLFKGMEENTRKKILAQFEADEERADLVRVLQMIGDGEPVNKVVEEANANLTN